MSGFLYRGYCYPDMPTVTKVILSQVEFVPTPTGPVVPYAVTFLPANLYGYGAVEYEMQSASVNNDTVETTSTSYSTIGQLQTCPTVGPFTNGFTISNLDVNSMFGALSAGAAFVFPIFAISWAAALVVNTIRGKR